MVIIDLKSRTGTWGRNGFMKKCCLVSNDCEMHLKNSYGSRRMKVAMDCLGYPISRNKARKLMREAGVQVRHRKKYKVTTNSNHKQPVFDNLLQRQFDCRRK